MEVLKLFEFFIGAILAVCLFGAAGLGVIAVHELGHLVAGATQGLAWETIKIGPFIRHRSSFRSSQYGSGWEYGYVSFDDSRATKRELTIALLGGPIASIGFALLLGQIDHVLWRYYGYDYPPLPILAISSMASGLFNLLPFRFRGFDSDGRQLYLLYRCSKRVKPSLGHNRAQHKPSRADLLKEDLPEYERVDPRDLPKL